MGVLVSISPFSDKPISEHTVSLQGFVPEPGLYFAESCTKADEYARDDTGHYSDVRALLLCRVCMGRIHYTTEPEPDALQKFLDGERDTRWQ